MTKSNRQGHPYIPNIASGVRKEMMDEIGIKDEMELFSMIPDRLRYKGTMNIPAPIKDEYSIKRHAHQLLNKNVNLEDYTYFLGAGCAPHFVPAVCDEINTRGEFLTAYDAMSMDDHGKYQALFEYSSLMAELLEMDNLGFPVYDGSTAVSHSMRIAARKTGRRKILVPQYMNPETLASIQNYLKGIPEDFMEIEFVTTTEAGVLDVEDLQAKLTDEIAGVFVENPSYLGTVETNIAQIANIAKDNGSELIVYVDPITLGVMEAPGNYGATIVCGDLHPLGIHMQAGGGVAGFIALPDDMAYLSNAKDLMISLTTTVEEGEVGYIFNNYDRSSYIAREEGNEYTGTGANLWAITAGVYLSLMGPEGMGEVGEAILKNMQFTKQQLSALANVTIKEGTHFKEFVVDFSKTNVSVEAINHALLENGIVGGRDLGVDFKSFQNHMLICVTEIHTKEEIDRFVSTLQNLLLEKGA